MCGHMRLFCPSFSAFDCLFWSDLHLRSLEWITSAEPGVPVDAIPCCRPLWVVTVHAVYEAPATMTAVPPATREAHCTVPRINVIISVFCRECRAIITSHWVACSIDDIINLQESPHVLLLLPMQPVPAVNTPGRVSTSCQYRWQSQYQLTVPLT